MERDEEQKLTPHAFHAFSGKNQYFSRMQHIWLWDASSLNSPSPNVLLCATSAPAVQLLRDTWETELIMLAQKRLQRGKKHSWTDGNYCRLLSHRGTSHMFALRADFHSGESWYLHQRYSMRKRQRRDGPDDGSDLRSYQMAKPMAQCHAPAADSPGRGLSGIVSDPGARPRGQPTSCQPCASSLEPMVEAGRNSSLFFCFI